VSDVIVVREVPAAQQLFLLFHGVGATPDDLVPIGEFLARAFPNSTVASVPAPFPSDFGSGLQWFSVNGVTEANRPARIEQAMPRFVQTVRELQRRFGVKPEATVLAGFSQGAIMALESGRLGHALAGRVVSLSGRFAQLPDTLPAHTRFHFLHGQDDGVVPVANAIEAAQKLAAGATIDVFPGMGHGISTPVAQRLVERLRAA
jgi:phospholipase/carboxylesterase